MQDRNPSGTNTMSADGYDRRRELQAFDDTKAGVKGLVDAGITTIPAIFHHPPESLPAVSATTTTTRNVDKFTLPVIDLASVTTTETSSSRREQVVAQVKAAAEAVGFFQVTNHGVPSDVLAEMLAAARRFHDEPAEAKRPYYSRDPAVKVQFNSNYYLFQSPAVNWRDTFFCQVAPQPPQPAELPVAVRDVMFQYGKLVHKLAVTLLELLSEALGLHRDYLREMGCAEALNVACHYYPPCPQPDLTLGTARHSDAPFLTLLLQDAMGGLQVLLHGDHWVDVPHLPGALVINIGDLLQIVSNKRFKSVEHRVLANRSSTTPRISVASFCNTSWTSTRIYGPIKRLISDGNPPLYRCTTVQEFLTHYNKKGLDGRTAPDYFLL